jgi:hypothetical protein
LGLRAGRCSPEDPVRGGVVEAGVLAGVGLERQQREGVDRLGRWLVCTQSSRRHQLGRGMAGVTCRRGGHQRQLELMAVGGFGAVFGSVSHRRGSSLEEEGGMLTADPIAWRSGVTHRGGVRCLVRRLA